MHVIAANPWFSLLVPGQTTSSRHDLNPGAETQLAKQPRAFLPTKTKGPHISHPDTGHDFPQHGGIRRGKVTLEHGLLRPIDQGSLRDPPLEVGVQLSCGGLAGDLHRRNLRFPVAPVHRVFFMHLHQAVLVVPDFLPEAQGIFVRIHFLYMTGIPAKPAVDIEPVTAPASRQVLPVRETPFVLCSGAQVDTANGGSVAQGKSYKPGAGSQELKHLKPWTARGSRALRFLFVLFVFFVAKLSFVSFARNLFKQTSPEVAFHLKARQQSRRRCGNRRPPFAHATKE